MKIYHPLPKGGEEKGNLKTHMCREWSYLWSTELLSVKSNTFEMYMGVSMCVFVLEHGKRCGKINSLMSTLVGKR